MLCASNELLCGLVSRDFVAPPREQDEWRTLFDTVDQHKRQQLDDGEASEQWDKSLVRWIVVVVMRMILVAIMKVFSGVYLHVERFAVCDEHFENAREHIDESGKE